MKVILTGMFESQLQEVADELRAEFPEVDVEIIDSRDKLTRLVPRARNAALVVAGRFIAHKTLFALKAAGVPTYSNSAGGAQAVLKSARAWLTRERRA